MRPVIFTLVSSVNIFAQLAVVVRQFGRSLIYIRKCSGPVILPCGTPQMMFLAFDKAPLTLNLF